MPNWASNFCRLDSAGQLKEKEGGFIAQLEQSSPAVLWAVSTHKLFRPIPRNLSIRSADLSYSIRTSLSSAYKCCRDRETPLPHSLF